MALVPTSASLVSPRRCRVSDATGQPRFTVSVETLVGLDYPTVFAYVQSLLQTAKTESAVQSLE
jgi:hypothetical protein